MPKYHYKQYVHRAFWNSLLAVLCALVLVLIVIYGWQGFKSVLERVLPEGEQAIDNNGDDDELHFLESLRGESTLSEEEQTVILEGLKAEEETETSTAEQQELLDSLKIEN